jgi:hypothetical protein
MFRSLLILSLLCSSLASSGASAATGVGSTRFGLSGPLTLIEGDLFLGANVEAIHRILPDFSIGGETGFHLHFGDVSAWLLPISVKGLYHFGIRGAPTFHPFVGMNVGVGILHASAGGFSRTNTDFLWLPQIGADIGSTRQFFAVLKLGVVGSGFVLAPHAGWWF